MFSLFFCFFFSFSTITLKVKQWIIIKSSFTSHEPVTVFCDAERLDRYIWSFMNLY